MDGNQRRAVGHTDANTQSQVPSGGAGAEEQISQAAEAVSKAIAAEAAESARTLPHSHAPALTIALLGAGVWGTALANLARENGHQVRVWSRRGTLSLDSAIADADILLSAIAMQGVPETTAKLQALTLPAGLVITSASKGLDAATLRTPSQIWRAAFPDNPFVVLSGPNLSVEIEQGLPAACVSASDDTAAAQLIQRAFACDRFRVYTNDDPIGTELGGTLKNVIAIAVGACDGLALGTNAKAGLMTRAVMEMIRVGTHLGGQPETFFGLSGLGDLMATCSSSLSRNYRVGYGLAQGQPLDQILPELQGTAEGVNTARVLQTLAEREQLTLPICNLVYRVLAQELTPSEAIAALMGRALKPEGIAMESSI